MKIFPSEILNIVSHGLKMLVTKIGRKQFVRSS